MNEEHKGMVTETVTRMVLALVTAHGWRIAAGHGTKEAAETAERMVEWSIIDTYHESSVPVTHKADGSRGKCTINLGVSKTTIGNRTLHLAITLQASDCEETGSARGAMMQTAISGCWGGWGERPEGNGLFDE